MIDNNMLNYREVKRVCQYCNNQDIPGFISMTGSEFAEYVDAKYTQKGRKIQGLTELRKHIAKIKQEIKTFKEIGCVLCPECEGYYENTVKV